MTKETRMYNEEKAVSSTSGAGKVGELHAKESNWATLLHHAQKHT